MFPFSRFVRLLPPSLQWVPWPSLARPCGSPPSPVLWGRKTAPASVRASFGRPLVARISRPKSRGVPPGVGEDGELSWVPGQPLWKHAPGYRHRRSQHNLAIAVAAECCLPPLRKRRHRNCEPISVLNPRGPLPHCVRFAPTGHPVNGNTRY